MAIKTWTGASGDGDFNNAANWSGGVPAGVYIDDAVFDAGSYSVTQNLSQGGVELKTLTVTRGYTGTIGISEATPLIIGCRDLCSLRPGTGGHVYIQGGTPDIEEVLVWPESVASVINLSGTIVASVIRKGTVTIPSGTFTNIWINPEGRQPTSVVGTINGGTITNLYGFGSHWTVTAGTITNVYWDGTGLIVKGGTITNYYIRAPGVVDHRTTNTTTLITVYPFGRIEFGNDLRAKTVTDVTLHRGGAVVGAHSRVTITNGVKDPLGFAAQDYGGSGLD